MPESELKKGGPELLDVLLTNLGSQQLLKTVLKKIQHEGNLELNQLVEIFQEAKSELTLPLSIFSLPLQPAEALCKYLKENEKLSYKEIGLLLSRNEKSVWATYQRAKKNKKQMFLKTKEKYNLPISIFHDRSYSVLESIVFFLHQIHQLSNPQIARLLKKSPNSVAVLMKRARVKDEL